MNKRLKIQKILTQLITSDVTAICDLHYLEEFHYQDKYENETRYKVSKFYKVIISFVIHFETNHVVSNLKQLCCLSSYMFHKTVYNCEDMISTILRPQNNQNIYI